MTLEKNIEQRIAMKIIVFDMDGVLVDIDSSWRFVHQKFRKDNQDNLRKYLDGEIDYRELVKRDVALWGDIHISQLQEILKQTPLMKGVSRTISTLRKSGYTIVIISAGISVLANLLQKKLGIDYVFANELSVDETGKILGKVEREVELLRKIDIFRDFTGRLKIPSHDCAVIGDSVFDIPLFREVGFSIAFNTNDTKVQRAANVTISNKDLTEILPFF